MSLDDLQRRGTGGIGKLFGPETSVWFLTLAVLGGQIVHTPAMLAAINPLVDVELFVDNGWSGFLVLGSVLWPSRAGKLCSRILAISGCSRSG